MFKPTAATTTAEYISMIDDSTRRAEIEQLHQLILATLPDQKPFIISGMIGYGKYDYKTKSGKAGEWARILLASQKNYIALHLCIMTGDGKYFAETLNDKFPKTTIGKSCIQIKKLADIDLDELKKILKESATLPAVGKA